MLAHLHTRPVSAMIPVMKIFRQAGSIAFVFGLFIMVFGGLPWYVVAAEDPVTPWWLRTAVFSFVGGILAVLLTLALEQMTPEPPPSPGRDEAEPEMPLATTPDITGRKTTKTLGLVQGQTVYAIWLGNDLSALLRLVLGGELTEYTDMMGKAREIACRRMTAQAVKLGADAVVNVRYMTTSVVGSAAELLVYGTAVKLGKARSGLVAMDEEKTV